MYTVNVPQGGIRSIGSFQAAGTGLSGATSSFSVSQGNLNGASTSLKVPGAPPSAPGVGYGQAAGLRGANTPNYNAGTGATSSGAGGGSSTPTQSNVWGGDEGAWGGDEGMWEF